MTSREEAEKLYLECYEAYTVAYQAYLEVSDKYMKASDAYMAAYKNLEKDQKMEAVINGSQGCGEVG